MRGYFKNLIAAILGRVSHEEGHNGTSAADYQRLVENLRERNAEKDVLIEHFKDCYRRQKESYENRLSGYKMEIANLQAKLKRHKKYTREYYMPDEKPETSKQS